MNRIVLLLFIMPLMAWGQCGVNAGFDLGNFTGWSGDTGDVVIVTNTYSYVNMTTPGIYNYLGYWRSNHIITSGTAVDPYSCNSIPVVCPSGGQYSMRLGNSEAICHAEDVKYTFRVNGANPIFVYSFAPVLQDPSHPDSIQPSFMEYVKDSVGFVIPCTFYRVTATNLRGALQCWSPGGSNAVSRPWRNIAIDLSAYAGQTVTVYFQTSDCGYCAHFGYAYLDVIGCYPKSITLNRCTLLGSTLTAPPGMDSYIWSNGMTGQTITVSSNIKTITCTMTTAMGCRITFTASALQTCPCPSISMITHN